MPIQNSLFPAEAERSAEFSPCRTYRYTLRRRWREGNDFVQFIGLNPSKADETTDDNTIRVCTSFAKKWRYDGLIMTNLFAYRATDPRVMKRAENPVGSENDKYLLKVAEKARIIVAVWSIHGKHLGRDESVKKLFPNRLLCIGRSKEGHPWHPLYKPGNLVPIPFN